ncbi:MAG: hypothetical protein LBI99_07990 [Propionibacteriaceae bacterium]|jgi:hypothetical protein|nr:hypothetical protein [Propionibacteriaceae bacterium]
MRNRAVILVASTVLLALPLSGCGASEQEVPTPTKTIVSHGDFIEYLSLEKSVEAADAVIFGTWVDSREELLFPIMDDEQDPAKNPQAGVELTEEELLDSANPVTISTIKITKVLKGKLAAGGTIDVRQFGGVKDGVRHADSDTTLLKESKSKNLLLLLTYWAEEDDFTPLNPIEGAWAVSGDKIACLSEAEPVFSIKSLDEVVAKAKASK